MPSEPEWWEWELDLDLDHLRERMVQRQFSETDVREMIEYATGIRPDEEPGRWIISARWEREMWEIVVEPQLSEQVLLVITAYKI